MAYPAVVYGIFLPDSSVLTYNGVSQYAAVSFMVFIKCLTTGLRYASLTDIIENKR